MRSGGSPGNDGRGWSPAQHPNSDRGAPDVPYGPEASWPNGFRSAEFDSGEYRQLVESSYGPDAGYGRYAGYRSDPGYAHVDPRQAQYGPAYQAAPQAPPPAPPARRRPDDDFGYGDPGYADPSYDGPRGNSGYPSQGFQSAPPPGPAYQPPQAYQPAPVAPAPPAVPQAPTVPQAPGGYQQPWPGASATPDPIYPVTGAQEVLRDAPAYEEPRRYEYDAPGYDDRRTADPRLAGLRYDELHYDEAGAGNDFPDGQYDEHRYDEPLDDDGWLAELRRSGPAGPRRAPGPQGPAGPGPAGPASGAWPAGPDSPASGYQQPPGYDRSSGYPPASGNDGHGGYGPRMSAVPRPGVGSGPMLGLPRGGGVAATPGASAAAMSPAAQQPQPAGFQSAPVFTQASVGVLTPPAGGRFQTRTGGPQTQAFPAPPAAAAPAAAGPPALGLAGPAVAPPGPATAPAPAMTGPDTAAWDFQAESGEAELGVLEQYWEEDEEDGGYSALLEDLEEDGDYRRDAATGVLAPPGKRVGRRDDEARDRRPRLGAAGMAGVAAVGKRVGRRRGGSNDHRLWLGLIGVAAVAGAAIFGIVKFEFPSNTGPAHELVLPASVGSYQWAPKLEGQIGLASLESKFRAMLGSSATNVVGRVYESGSETTGSAPQLVVFMGGHLPNQSPDSSIHNFMQKFPGAQPVSAGSMGGDAACVETSPGTADSQAYCAWFDNDSVGVVTSTTMPAGKLASVMVQFRPSVELTKK